MYPDYLSLVIEEYEMKLAQNAISQRLINPTRASLRDECLEVCHHRYQKKDEGCLATFFGLQKDHASYLKAIEMHDIEKFKPLINYLNKLKTGKASTGKKNIELLAWLIDFEDRPFILGKVYKEKAKQSGKEQENTEEEIPVLPGGVAEDERKTDPNSDGHQANKIAKQQDIVEEDKKAEPDASPEPIREPVKETSGGTTKTGDAHLIEPVKSTITFKKQRITILAIVLISSLSLGGYWLGNKNSTKPVLTGQEGCMYWTGDHYEQIPCNQKMDGVLVIALDAEKLTHFKKITNTDTITSKSKGWVWYTKIDNVVEFFTSDGYHPIQYERRLRPVTDRIIDRYVQRK
ncbi:hypothetical protein HNQ91_001769 [Filimonas zeae]|uniref:Uncharacterized protein n=1 Tax=Filimonas zeae TaxID=1737353 RepID=A0A917IXS6_9BACT|nr:hypothetical protein [Filimonas zeae]MDR6338718.1 hypothetical protein [Filimonas zeae]GGH66910.1 hypothetical protein GCM10011379_21580 [Filimonas zeae]